MMTRLPNDAEVYKTFADTDDGERRTAPDDALVSNVRSVDATLTTTTTHDVNRCTRDQLHDEELDRRPSRCKQLESNVEVSM